MVLDIVATGSGGVLSVMFTLIGAKYLLKLPVSELTNQSYSLEELLGREVEEQVFLSTPRTWMSR